MLKVNLTEDNPRPLRIETPEGAAFRFHIKRRLTRQQRQAMTKSVGRGVNEKQVGDLRAIYRACIESIEIIEGAEISVPVENGEPAVYGPGDRVTESEHVYRLLNEGLPEDIVDPVNSYVMRLNTLEEVQGNT